MEKEKSKAKRHYLDERDWKKYNAELVKRGEFFLDLEFVSSWDNELVQMNKKKVGKPFEFPNSLIQLQSIWHAFKIPYRMCEGITQRLQEFSKLPAFNDYSTINRRVNNLKLKLLPPKSENLTIFADGTGLQVIESGEYLREKYGKKNRRWVQIVLWGDSKSKEPVSFEVNIIQTCEHESARRQLNSLTKKDIQIEAAGGDGSFDTIPFWNAIEQKGIRPIIKPDKNARDDSDSVWRNINVKQRDKIGHEKWVNKTGYGMRWPATEGIFSATKRIFGECLHARSEHGILQEAAIKFWAYQRIKRYSESTV